MNRLTLSLLCLTFATPLLAQGGGPPGETPEQRDARTKWFREAKFGVFICWGPCSIAEGEIGWSRGGPRPGVGGTGEVPLEVYDNLYKRFNPTKFNAREWAKLVKDAGARYVIFLTKHHDGFCMFDSKLTDYKVTRTPFGRDVTAELAQAFHEAGIRIFWYYSQPDWHHPDYLTENHARYIDYFHGHVRELLTRYGRIDGMWFDCLQGTAETWDTPRLFAMIRTLQPGILINNRGGWPGDFDTPEQTIGTFQIDRPWESCMTMSTGWSWLGEKAPVKSLTECLHLLIRCAGGGGNLALDTGPMPDGRIDPRQAANYRGMGQWLRRYGESIYATTGGPYTPSRSMVSTRAGNRVYLHVLNWDEDDLVLPPIPAKVIACSALTGGTPMCTQSADALRIRLRPERRDPTDTIIRLELDSSAEAIRPISIRAQQSLAVGKRASASGIWNDDYSAQKAFDGDEATRWGCTPDSRSGWLEVDLGEPKTVDHMLVLEAPWNRVQKYQLQVLEGDTWRTVHEGTTLGDATLRFAPVTAQRFRLNILEANEVPTIWEVYLYPPSAR
ncbi:MAG TPA: alpha-L-fucosidase [Armatimonadota bacterium]|nr:alpha-L-fucosidase [Armatimonadota bacterium]